MTDLLRIKENVASMAAQGASEAEIDEYITVEEGVSIEDVRAFQGGAQPPQAQQRITDQNFMQSLWEGGKQGSTIGASDELQAGIAALYAKYAPEFMGNVPADERAPIGELYDDALGDFRSELAGAREQHPYATLGGEVAGAFVPAMGMAKGVTSASTLGKYGQGARMGAGAGGIYGFNTGEDGFANRALGAAISAPVGALGGVAGVAASNAIGKAVRSDVGQKLTNRAKDIFHKKQILNLTKREASDLAAVEKGKIFTKSKGQATQDPNIQQVEAEAMGKVYGEEAAHMSRMAQVMQSRERRGFLSKLGDIDKAGDANDVVEGVFETIMKQAKSLKGKVDSAYTLAREGGGVKINTDDIHDGLFASIIDFKRQGQYDIGMMPHVQSTLKPLISLVRKSSGGKVTSANLSSLENWRTRVTRGLKSSTDPSEKQMLKGMLKEYDDFMYRTANEAVDNSDEAAILAFRDAVSKRREYGKLYETDNFVKDLVSGKKGLDDAVKDLIGTGQLVGKKRMESTFDAIVKAAGDESELVIRDLQAGFAKKLLQQSIKGRAYMSPEESYLSALETQKALKGLFVNNRNFAKKLFGEDNYKAALGAIDELEIIGRSQPATQNPSGSGLYILRALNKIPFMNIASKSFETAGKSIKEGAVRKSLKELIDTVPIDAQSNLFKPRNTGAAAAIMEKQYKNIPHATIYGDVDYSEGNE